jgi:flotillin
VESELKKIGLRLINVNVTDITDESGYIEALGKEAAAKAINDAKKSVAEKDRDGSIGEANAHMDQRVQVARANSEAIKGENDAKIIIAKTDANRREKEAEALRIATAAEKIQSAKALEESYQAEQQAELARAAREKATLEADVVIKAQIAKQKLEIEAEAEAEQMRRRAAGEADAIFAKMDAQARGLLEMLTKQAEGYASIVNAAGGNPSEAAKLMITDKLEEIVKLQVEAVSNLKIDKVTVWDSGAGSENGSSTANFLSGLLKSLPPLSDVFKTAGMELPEVLGKPAAGEGTATPEK